MQREIVFMFSGQGSQYNKMGIELYEDNAVFHQSMDDLDTIFQSLTGKSVVEELYLNPKRKGSRFEDIFYTHPAIFMIQYALALTLAEKGIHPNTVLGVSLGEYVALAVAKVITPEQALTLIVKQVELLRKHCKGGAMIAVLDNERLYHENLELNTRSELIAVNYEKHFTVACKREHTKEVQQFLKDKNITSLKLPVHYAFHSAAIDELKEPYCALLQSVPMQPPAVRFVSSVMGGTLQKIGPEFLWDVLRQPMNFRGALQSIPPGGQQIFIDLGPSGTLENFSKNILDNAEVQNIRSVITPLGSDLKKLNEVVAYCEHMNLKRDGWKPKMKAYLFPGQGAQSVGMGGKLFKEFPEYTRIADQVLGYSIEELCLENKNKLLDITAYTQPALYVVNVLSYLKENQETGQVPDYVAGHSLGEYSALYAAGVFDFETGLKIVQKRAELMHTATGGGMAAVLGLTENQIRTILTDNHLDTLDVANLNTPTQIAISGPKENILAAKEVFENNGATAYVILNVSGAFHSRYMHDSARQFRDFLLQFNFSSPSIPVISNLTARPYTLAKSVHYMTEQMVSSVKWCETVCYLMGRQADIELKQVGPGHVIAGLISKIKREAEPLTVDDVLEEELPAQDEAEVLQETAEDPILITTVIEQEVQEDVTPIQLVSESQPEPSQSKMTVVAPGSRLGSTEFKQRYGLKYAYLMGGMNDGISSKELVVQAALTGCLAFLGASGMNRSVLEDSIRYIRRELGDNQTFGVTVTYHPIQTAKEEQLIDVLIRENVRLIEASSYLTLTPALVKYRLKGLTQEADGTVRGANRIIAKVSRPDIAKMFMLPPPERIVDKLLAEGLITPEQARLARLVPMADDLCSAGDSAGPTDQANILSLLPTIMRLRRELSLEFEPAKDIHIGAAGGIGTPEAAAGVFLMGADFILTGSINQCTVESGASPEIKDVLEQVNVYDMAYVPSLELFELGGKAQVVKKGLFFSARANKLYEIYRNVGSIPQIDSKTRSQLEDKYFGRTIQSILDDCKRMMTTEELAALNGDPKQQMAAVFKWYIENSKKSAIAGEAGNKVNYSIMCGPAIGSFNQWVKGTSMEAWRNRRVGKIAAMIMDGAAEMVKGEVV